MNLKLTAGTVADLLRGIEWFDRIALGVGDQFKAEFYRALDRIKQSPELFAVNLTGYRPCRLKRFTAVLYFRVDEDCIIVVGLFTKSSAEVQLERHQSPSSNVAGSIHLSATCPSTFEFGPMR